MQNIKFLFFLTFLAFTACQPEEVAIELGELPPTPEISVRQLPESPNFVEIELLSDNVFEFIWDAPGGNPNISREIKDTIFYSAAGNYDISVHITAIGGSGTATNKETVNITADAQGICDDLLDVLTGGCESKCWLLSEAAGSVKVGPSQLSGEWFTSPNIDPAQANDRYCFTADGFSFLKNDGGDTFSACQGYVAVTDYPYAEDISFGLESANSEYAEQQIIFNKPMFIGVEDSGPFYQIVSISEEELVLLAPTAPCDGSPTNGWFTLTLIAE